LLTIIWTTFKTQLLWKSSFELQVVNINHYCKNSTYLGHISLINNRAWIIGCLGLKILDSTAMWHSDIHVFWTLLTFWPIFLQKALLDTGIGRLNPEFYNSGSKNMDSTVQFAFAPMATWRNPTNRIHSHTCGITLRWHVFLFKWCTPYW